MYMWCADFPQDEIMFELGMGVDCRSTVIDWANFMRDVSQEFLNRNPQEIGGFGETLCAMSPRSSSIEIRRRLVGLVTTVNN